MGIFRTWHNELEDRQDGIPPEKEPEDVQAKEAARKALEAIQRTHDQQREMRPPKQQPTQGDLFNHAPDTSYREHNNSDANRGRA